MNTMKMILILSFRLKIISATDAGMKNYDCIWYNTQIFRDPASYIKGWLVYVQKQKISHFPPCILNYRATFSVESMVISQHSWIPIGWNNFVIIYTYCNYRILKKATISKHFNNSDKKWLQWTITKEQYDNTFIRRLKRK